MKTFILASCTAICLLVLGFPAQAQKLPVSTKTFEAIARSSFLKAGGAPANFDRFYREISSYMAGKSLSRAELTKLTRIYLNTGSSVRRSYELAKTEHKQLEDLLHTPTPQKPFISADNLSAVLPPLWRRANVGTPDHLARFEDMTRGFLSQYPNRLLTLQELENLASQFVLEGESAVKRFFARQDGKTALTHIQLNNINGKPPVDVYVYPSQIRKLLQFYQTGVAFFVRDGRVYAAPERP